VEQNTAAPQIHIRKQSPARALEHLAHALLPSIVIYPFPWRRD
jgi:hypothetical protein